MATQNVTSSTGTFPLPEPQLDRFLISIPMSLPDVEVQKRILNMQASGGNQSDSLDSLLDIKEILQLQKQAAEVPISEALNEYIIDLCEMVRRSAGGGHTISVRASLALMRAAQANAFLDGQPAVHPDHVQAIFPHVMRHRLIPDDGSSPDPIITGALRETPVP